MNATSFTDRETLWHDMQSGVAGPWDIIVVGGGITGAGILREAVRTTTTTEATTPAPKLMR